MLVYLPVVLHHEYKGPFLQHQRLVLVVLLRAIVLAFLNIGGWV